MIHLFKTRTYHQAGESEFLPCPCCGSHNAHACVENNLFLVKCFNCGLRTGAFGTSEFSMMAWNQRADALGHEELLERLHAELNDKNDDVFRCAVSDLNKYFETEQ